MEINKSRIVLDMCMTWRHDYGLEKESLEVDAISSGITRREREHLHRAMSQLFDLVIRPEFERAGITVVD